MKHQGSIHRAMGGAAVLGLALLVSACLLAPGKFMSSLDVRESGAFTFRYSGELHLLPLSKMGDAEAKFEPQACYSSDGEEIECSAGELEEQLTAWEEEQERKSEKDERDAEAAKMFLGGINPSDPAAAEEFAKMLRRQTGWHKVDHKGDGLFEVDFAITSRLDHDFVFPTIERFPMANAFVQLSLREDGTVRIDAPGYGPGMAGGPMSGLMAAASMAGDKTSESGPKPPTLDGRFTITTDAEILANNTDEGPTVDTAGQRLDWTVTARTVSAPTALLKLPPRKAD